MMAGASHIQSWASVALLIIKLTPFGISGSRLCGDNRRAGREAHLCCVLSSYLSCVKGAAVSVNCGVFKSYHASALGLLSIVLDYTDGKHQ